MKKLLALSALLSTPFALSNTSIQELTAKAMEKNTLHQGFLVGLKAGSHNIKIEAKQGTNTVSDSENFDGNTITVGYQRLRAEELGYRFEVTKSAMYGKGITLDILSVGANLNYGINQNLYTYGGLSMYDISTDYNSDSKEVYDDFETGAGLQLALGYKVHKNISGEIRFSNSVFTQDRKTSNGNEFELEFSENNLQFGLVGTF